MKRVALTRDDKERLFPKEKKSGVSREKEMILHLANQQSWICFWCGCKMTNDDPFAPTYRTIEHLVAKATGWKRVNTLANLRAACSLCNNLRAQWNIGVLEKETARLKAEVGRLQNVLHEKKFTMSGRCYYCEIRYHVKTWWFKHFGVTA